MQVRNEHEHLRNLVFAALFAAAITVMTAYILHIPIGTGGGYIHLGDTLIYLAATLLPLPWGVAAAAIGAGLADLLTAPAWVLATVIIKSILALLFSSKGDRLLSLRNAIAPVIALVVTSGGYYVAEGILYGNWITPLASIPANLIQAGGSAILFYVLALALDKARIKHRLTSHRA